MPAGPSVDGVRNVIRLLGAGNDKIRRLKRKIWSTTAWCAS
jgi:hypothetical protein